MLRSEIFGVLACAERECGLPFVKPGKAEKVQARNVGDAAPRKRGFMFSTTNGRLAFDGFSKGQNCARHRDRESAQAPKGDLACRIGLITI